MKAPIRNHTPRPTSSQGQYSAISSPGPVASCPVVLSKSTIPTPIQTTGQVNDQTLHRPGRRSMTDVTSEATPTRITNSGHA